MAIIKFIGVIHPSQVGGQYAGLKKTIDYILNPSKTQGKYVDSINCTTSNTLNEMIATKKHFGKTSKSKHERYAYHFTISWSPDEKIEYDEALKVTLEFCQRYLPDYECVFSVHTDQLHCHSHIVFNSINIKDGKKYHYADGDWAKIIQPLLDEICKTHHLHTLFEDTGMTYAEYEADRKKKKCKNKKDSKIENQEKKEHKYRNNKYYNEKVELYNYSDMIKNDIDEIILNVHSIEEFYEKLTEYGYYVRKGQSAEYGEYFSLKGRGMDKARRNYKLGHEYFVENIIERINVKDKPLPVMPSISGYKYIVSYQYWRKPFCKRTLTDFEKREYVRLYQSGMCPKDYFPSYKGIKKHLQAINRINNEIQLIDEYKIYDVPSSDMALKEIDNELKQLKENRKEYYHKKKPYIHLLKNYYQMKKYENGYLLYISGNKTYDKEYEEYLKCKDIIDKYGFSEIEIVTFKESLSVELKNINTKIREVSKKYKSIKSIKEELLIDVEPEIVEKYFNAIPEQYQVREYQKVIQQKIRK